MKISREGKLNKQTGIFPANFVEKIPTDSYVSNFDFEASQDGDLGFVKGQTIKVLEKMGDWWKGETQARRFILKILVFIRCYISTS